MRKEFTPNNTPTPNFVYDILMRKLPTDAFYVLLAMVRKTYGWESKRTMLSDQISLSQLMEMTGKSKNFCRSGRNYLIENKYIELLKKESRREGALYRVTLWEDSEGQNLDDPEFRGAKIDPPEGQSLILRGSKSDTLEGQNLTPQKKDLNKTLKKEKEREDSSPSTHPLDPLSQKKEFDESNSVTSANNVITVTNSPPDFGRKIQELLFQEVGSTFARTKKFMEEIEELYSISEGNLEIIRSKMKQYKAKQLTESWFKRKHLTINNLLFYWNEIQEVASAQEESSYEKLKESNPYFKG